MDHPKTPFFVWSWTSRDIHSYIHTSSYIYSALSQVDDTIPPWFLVDYSSKSSKQWLVTSLKAPDPRKKTHLQTPLPGSYHGDGKGAQSWWLVWVNQKKRWKIHSVPNTFSPGFWRILDVQDKESWVQMRWCNEQKNKNTSTAVLHFCAKKCAWNLQSKFKCAMVVLWFFRGCKSINVFFSQQEGKQNYCFHQMLEGWRVDILHNIPNGMTQIWKSWNMKGPFWFESLKKFNSAWVGVWASILVWTVHDNWSTFRDSLGNVLWVHHKIGRLIWPCVRPLKINMEPKNHPIEKENHLNQTSILGFNMLIFQGVLETNCRNPSFWQHPKSFNPSTKNNSPPLCWATSSTNSKRRCRRLPWDDFAQVEQGMVWDYLWLMGLEWLQVRERHARLAEICSIEVGELFCFWKNVGSCFLDSCRKSE